MTRLRCPACKAQKWTRADLDNHLQHCSWAQAQWLVAEARWWAERSIEYVLWDCDTSTRGIPSTRRQGFQLLPFPWKEQDRR